MERLFEPGKYQPQDLCGRSDASFFTPAAWNAGGESRGQFAFHEQRDGHREGDTQQDVLKKPSPDSITAFQQKTGVDVTEKDGKYEYRLSGNSKGDVLFTTEASDKGLDAGGKKLKELVEEKVKSIKNEYRVTFAREGDDVVKQWVRKDDCSYAQGKMIKARDPMLKELVGVEAALERSQPSNVTPDGKGAKIHFLTEKKSDDAQAAYHIRDGGSSQIYFDPGMTEQKPILETDSEALKRNIQYSIEAITVHEFAHAGQRNMDWSVPVKEEKFARETGWASYEDPKTHEREFLIRGKNGEFYKRGQDHCTEGAVWALADSSGQLLGPDKKVAATFKDAKTFSADEVKQNAVVKPPTDYFANPLEMYAEGIMMFRLGQSQREALLKQSPEMYKSVKSFDQDEVNKIYGVVNGAAKYIRSPKGLLVHNTESNRKQVADFEASNLP